MGALDPLKFNVNADIWGLNLLQCFLFVLPTLHFIFILTSYWILSLFQFFLLIWKLPFLNCLVIPCRFQRAFTTRLSLY